MNGARRIWLLWRAASLRKRADALTRHAIDKARELRRQAAQCELEALRLAGTGTGR